MSCSMYEQWRAKLFSIWSHQYDGSVPRACSSKHFSGYNSGFVAAIPSQNILHHGLQKQVQGGVSETHTSGPSPGALDGSAASWPYVKKIPNEKFGRCAEIFQREQCAFGNFKAVAGIKIVNSGLSSDRKFSRGRTDFSVPIGLGGLSSSVPAGKRTIRRACDLGDQDVPTGQNPTYSGRRFTRIILQLK